MERQLQEHHKLHADMRDSFVKGETDNKFRLLPSKSSAVRNIGQVPQLELELLSNVEQVCLQAFMEAASGLDVVIAPAVAPPMGPSKVGRLVRAKRVARPLIRLFMVGAAGSKVLREMLRIVSPPIAHDTVVRIAVGGGKMGHSPAVPPAETNDRSFWLARNGTALHCEYRRIGPYIGGVGTHASPEPERRAPQLLHRLSIRAWGTEDEQRAMLEPHLDTSHLSHAASCFNLRHLKMESR